MESSTSLSTAYPGSKRAREDDLPAGAEAEAEAKRLRPEDLLDMLDDVETDGPAGAGDDLASVMRSLEEEISAGELELDLDAGPPQPELGFLLEASDDELGLPPPSGASGASSDDYPEDADFSAQIWAFDDEAADYGFGSAVTSSPEAAAAAAAAAAEWGDDGFDAAGLFGFGDDAFGPSDLAALRHETMPAV